MLILLHDKQDIGPQRSCDRSLAVDVDLQHAALLYLFGNRQRQITVLSCQGQSAILGSSKFVLFEKKCELPV